MPTEEHFYFWTTTRRNRPVFNPHANAGENCEQVEYTILCPFTALKSCNKLLCVTVKLQENISHTREILAH